MRLLVVEDDPDLNRQLVTALSDAGYAVDTAFDGEEGHFLGDTEPYDAVVLDLGLPKKDGLSVLEQWRRDERKMPVLILTARERWSDKVAGMDAGADDYVAKPFHMEEVLARVRALLRRAAGHASNEIECGPLRLDTKTARVTVDGQAVKLTSHEYRVLAYLMLHRNRVVSRTELVEHLYEQDFDRDSNTVEVFIGRLRKKLPWILSRLSAGSAIASRTPTMRFNSLAFRLFASAAVWTLVVLPVTAVLLVSLYRTAVERSFDARLNVYMTSLVASSTVGGARQPKARRRSANRSSTFPFAAGTGRSKPRDGWTVLSRLGLAPRPAARARRARAEVAPDRLTRSAYAPGPEGQHLRVLERVRPAAEFPFLVAGDVDEMDRDSPRSPAAVCGARRARAWPPGGDLVQVRYGLAAQGIQRARGDPDGPRSGLPGSAARSTARPSQRADPIQPRDRRPGAHACRQSRACAEDTADGDEERGGSPRHDPRREGQSRPRSCATR